MSQVATLPAVLSLKDAAARLGVSTDTVRRIIASGRLRAIRLSQRRIGVPVDAVDSYLEGGGWQSDVTPAVVGTSSFSRAEDAFFAAARRAERKRKPSSGKPSSGGNSSEKLRLVKSQ